MALTSTHKEPFMKASGSLIASMARERSVGHLPTALFKASLLMDCAMVKESGYRTTRGLLATGRIIRWMARARWSGVSMASLDPLGHKTSKKTYKASSTVIKAAFHRDL